MDKYYERDGITIYHSETIQAMKAIPDESVDLVLTSPPYPGAEMWQSSISDIEALNISALGSAETLVKPGGVIAWNIADVPRAEDPKGALVLNVMNTIRYATESLGLYLYCDVIWDKGIPHLPPVPYMRRPALPALNHEHVLIFFKGKWSPRELKSGLADLKSFMPSTVWKITPETRSSHIAAFPYELARRCVGFWSMPGDTVLDPFCGSGTTLRVCKDYGRIGIGIEHSEEYCKMSVDRLSQDTLFKLEEEPSVLIERLFDS